MSAGYPGTETVPPGGTALRIAATTPVDPGTEDHPTRRRLGRECRRRQGGEQQEYRSATRHGARIICGGHPHR